MNQLRDIANMLEFVKRQPAITSTDPETQAYADQAIQELLELDKTLTTEEREKLVDCEIRQALKYGAIQ